MYVLELMIREEKVQIRREIRFFLKKIDIYFFPFAILSFISFSHSSVFSPPFSVFFPLLSHFHFLPSSSLSLCPSLFLHDFSWLPRIRSELSSLTNVKIKNIQKHQNLSVQRNKWVHLLHN